MSIEPIVQMGMVEKLAENLENQPVIQQQVTQTEAERILREQNAKVPPPEAPEKSKGRRVGERGDEPGERGRNPKDSPDKRGEEDPEPPPNPWSGNILNLKV